MFCRCIRWTLICFSCFANIPCPGKRCQHCQISKKNISLPTCMFGPLRWSMPKITISDAKLSEIYEQNEWHLFSGQCNLRFLNSKVLQGSIATCVNYGRIFIDSTFAVDTVGMLTLLYCKFTAEYDGKRILKIG